MPQHGESFELLLEQLPHRFGCHVAPGEAGATGADDHVHAAIVDPAAYLLLNVKLAVAHQRARRQAMARGDDALGEQVAGGVRGRVARIGNSEYRDAQRSESARGINPAARHQPARRCSGHRFQGFTDASLLDRLADSAPPPARRAFRYAPCRVSAIVRASSCVRPYTASICGVGVRVRRPSSTTDPTSASSSGRRPASTSCSMEVLWWTTLSAPAIRLSRLTRNTMPSLCAMVCASVIIAAASARVAGNWQMSASVERVSALMGLKVRLPQSLSQISARMSSSTGALNPARAKHCETRCTRSLLVPSSSPTGKRSPSICFTTPGAMSSAAGYTTQPTTLSAGIIRPMTPPASTLRTTLPAHSPPWCW